MNLAPYPESLGVIQAPDDRLEGYSADALNRAYPQALARPKDEAEVARLLAFCNRERIPVTPCGNQTSLTAGSISNRGLLLSTEKLAADWRVYADTQRPGHYLAEVGPAVILSQFQDGLAAQGYFYPPDPTSRREILLGATISTNASGEDSYLYGSTRAWVRGLRYVRADGTIAEAWRDPAEQPSRRKNTCGYPLRDSDVDLLIGSEGTLGIVTRAWVEVLPRVPTFFSCLFFLPDEAIALAQVPQLHTDFHLRCLEYMDAGAVAILREKGVPIPARAATALYIKQEFAGDGEPEMARLLEYLESLYDQCGLPEFIDHVHLADDAEGQAQMRIWRHHIPATINEWAAGFKKDGGGKVSTDWYVPLSSLPAMFSRVRSDQGEMAWVVFGHIGNGHPHFNFVTKNEAEYRRGRELLEKHCRMAVAYGGGVSGEHGLGKMKSHLLTVQYSAAEIADMVAVKHRFDPHHILAPGNIFPAAILQDGGAS